MEPLKKYQAKEFNDERGVLRVLDRFPFQIKRVFSISDINSFDVRRGGHAHRFCQQVLCGISGRFLLSTDDGTSCNHFDMGPGSAVYVPAMQWISLQYFQPDAVCLVLCSHPYDVAEVISGYEEFKREVQHE